VYFENSRSGLLGLQCGLDETRGRRVDDDPVKVIMTKVQLQFSDNYGSVRTVTEDSVKYKRTQ
jgi:hypothetical protein